VTLAHSPVSSFGVPAEVGSALVVRADDGIGFVFGDVVAMVVMPP
jgi:hypothetical protein